MYIWRRFGQNRANVPAADQRNYSVIRAFSGFTILIAVVLVINMVLGILSVFDLRNHNQNIIQRTVSEYYAQQETRFNSVRHFVEWTAVNEKLLEEIRKDADEGTIGENLSDLRSRIRDMQYSFGGSFTFYVCKDDGSRFYNLSDLTVSYSDYLDLKELILREATDPTKKPLRWKVFRVTNSSVPYLYYGVRYQQMYVTSVIRTDALAGSLDTLSMGKSGHFTLSAEDGTVLLRKSGTGGSSIPLFYQDFREESTNEGLPFTIDVHADVYSSIAEQQLRQILILLALLVMLSVAIRYIYKVYKSVLQPLEKFQQTLMQADSEDSLLSLDDVQVRELAAASRQMKMLVTDLHNMRIKMYEEELEKKKFEITFLQHQIRPHFYLNCLSTIDSMAQLGETEQMRQMLLFTSRYIRYLFQTGRDFVRLRDELDHIEAYLGIQNLRMGNAFLYTLDCDAEVLEASVPPLFLITFVENCVKHAASPDGSELKIHIRAKHVNEQLLLNIEDSGMGFAPSVTTGTTPRQDHIGIRNSIRRLQLIYGDDLSLKLSNKAAPDHGACVQILLPWNVREQL